MSAHLATSGSVRRRPEPPIQMGGCGRCTGTGRSWALSRLNREPWYDTTSPVNSLVSISSSSSKRSKRRPVGGNSSPELTVLGVVPRRADGELEPAPAGVVDGDGLGGQDRRDGGKSRP